ncbi:MAG: TRAP transporter small permease [Rhodomicrobiaceae bacterium]|jgi:C4-dicarboxylate transporter DctQ subunit
MNRNSSSLIDQLEETLIALILGFMTLLTFANVIARYVFNSNILWALEATVFLFAWLVLLGVSYGVKKNFHIGVDVIVGALPNPLKKILSLVAVSACILFSLLMLKGAWDYWLPFIGRRAFLEVNDIPMLPFLQFFAHWLNDGELYEKMPRFIPYAVLPIGMSLLTFRFIEAGWRILTNQQDLIIAGHEAEEMLEEVTSLQPPHHNKKED